MLLDYKYIKKQGKLSVSYVNKDGMKSVIDFNIDKFKSFYSTPNGRFVQPDGSKCDIKYTNDPSPFDLRTFFKELSPEYKKLFEGKTSPKLYTFDIETKLREDREFEEPGNARQPIHTISVVSPEMKTVVMGDKYLSPEDIQWIQDQIQDYLNKLPFFHTLNLALPTFKYQYYDNERDMLEYFFKGIVAKVPILSGWNNIRYDWQYITTRVREFFPDLSMTCASTVYQCTPKKFTDMKGNDFRCPMPLHTPIIDMSQVMDFDLAVMPIKEANSLDYIASETPGLGVHKIEYDGDLEILYERDFRRYVFYNAIDSILVQLINYRYKTLETMYMQALYCGVKIQDTFSKIAVSEALAWDDFYEHGYKIVYEKDWDRDRGRLRGAYVVKPIPGKWDFITCNDFASLYPSTIITCNISFENYITHYYDEARLDFYRKNPEDYVVIGPVVLVNEGTAAKPELGEEIGTFIDDAKLEPYRKDPNYFVSVNGHIYKNDKDYSFKRIQANLKATRNISKYLSKQLDAMVMLDVEHIIKGTTIQDRDYADNLVDAMKQMGYDIRCTHDLYKMSEEQLLEFKRILGTEITFYECKEQAMKLLGNSMYGGSSHVAFYWFNINLARDITGEARNLTKLMESHLPKFWDENWGKMTEWHKKWGYEVDQNKIKQLLAGDKHMIVRVYGDTDSLYISYANLLSTIKGYDQMTQRQKLDVIVHINTDFLNDHNKKYMEEYYASRHVKSIHDFELETVALSGLWLDVKKRYCQILLWKDGKYFDNDSLPMKVKGLEMTKSSYPKFVRENLKKVVRSIMENTDVDMDTLWAKTNILVQQTRQAHMNAQLEDICENKGVNGYTKYIITEDEYNTMYHAHITAFNQKTALKKQKDPRWKTIKVPACPGKTLIDKSGTYLYTAPKCSIGVRALGDYNAIREAHNLKSDPIYGGKCKIYYYKPTPHADVQPFAFQARNYPKWGAEYAPVDHGTMFQKYFLDPLNRICGESMKFKPFKLDGSREMTLFDLMGI